MAVRQIRLFGDSVLRKQAAPIDKVDRAVQDLADDLIETVDSAGGLGLAAPQIGVSKRAIVVVEIDDKGGRNHLVLINPEIVSACGEECTEEGCLSVPGIYANVKRPQSVVVKGLDREGRAVDVEAMGLMARALAHEIDHLDGILFVDRLSAVKRGLLRKRLSEIRKKAREMASSPE
jgi:peptide deformylase